MSTARPGTAGFDGTVYGQSHEAAFISRPTIDAVEADTFSFVVVQDFNGVAVEDGDDGAGERGGTDNSWDE